ncbi:MBL fold metallo-hydrolase [Azospirillum sp. A39]|uniref:MBL fold metallo-hydrolase n=1 Tax=Azospirillum sp. A39 TaxID=3462279 RepID=UPI00404540E2
MDIHVLGVGGAADPDYPNAAIAVAADGYRLLIDCGHSVPPVLWRKMPDADAVDAIALTGATPDRAFGVAPLLLRWAEDGRRKPLDLAVAAADAARIDGLLEAAGLAPQRGLPYAVRRLDLGAERRLGPFGVATAPPAGGAAAGLTVGLEWGGTRCVYGAILPATPEALTLVQDCRLAFHACDGGDGAELDAVARLAEERRIAAVRLLRVRRGRREAVAALAAAHPRLSLALPGQLVRLQGAGRPRPMVERTADDR